jgi:hypothetical protein
VEIVLPRYGGLHKQLPRAGETAPGERGRARLGIGVQEDCECGEPTDTPTAGWPSPAELPRVKGQEKSTAQQLN